MWAVINKKTQIVIGVLLPDATTDQIEQTEKIHDLVLMTIDNSPATIGDTYRNGKFEKEGN
jgi:hypothetical protein